MMSPLRTSDEMVVGEAGPSRETVRGRSGAIDGLRALAISAIVVYEIVRLAPALVAGNGVWTALAFDASQGLTLFLILSGYTLAYPAIVACVENGRAHFDVGRFIVKRLSRIYPSYLAALGLAIALPPLAVLYGVPALAGGPGPTSDVIWRNVIFAGDGLGNDGFRALAIIARCYVVFPLLLFVWARARAFFPGLLVLAVVLDLTTGLHGLGIGALVPFALGIVAAEVRSQNLAAYRFGLPLAFVAGAAALRLGAGIASVANAHAPGALRIDPLWSIALFGIVVASGALVPLRRMLSIPPLRLLGGTSFAVSLVVVPVSAFAIRQLAGPFGIVTAAANAAVASLALGLLLYRIVDRTFEAGPVRRDLAARAGPPLAALLARIGAQRVLLGALPVAVEAEIARPQPERSFRRPELQGDAANMAIVSQRTGSAAELAADMAATRTRLAERSAAASAREAGGFRRAGLGITNGRPDDGARAYD